MNGSWHRIVVKITWRRNDSCDAGTNIITSNDSFLADPYAIHIGDGVVLAGGKDADFQAGLSGSRPFFRLCRDSFHA